MGQPNDHDPGAQEGPGDRCEELVDRVTLVGLVFESANGLRRVLEPSVNCMAGASAPWFEVLIRLARSPGGRLRMSDLAAQTSLTPSGLTRAVDRLTEQELVTREACPGDRRGAYAALTDRGRADMEAFLPRHEEVLTSLLEGIFSPAVEQLFIELLHKLRDKVHPGGGRVPETEAGGAAGT